MFFSNASSTSGLFLVYTDKFRFFTSSSRTYPATAGACDPADVELLTAEWVHWYNTSRLMHRLDRTPPVEFEARYYTQQSAAKTEAHQ